MDYLARGARCIGGVCYDVGSAIGRGAVQTVASLPITTRNTYRNHARRAIATLSPDAMRFYREAFVQGAVGSDGRINRDSIRRMGFFEEGYPFPGGPIADINIPFRELQGQGLIHFPGRNRHGAHGINRRPEGAMGLVANLVEGSRQLERTWGLREPNAPFLPNVVHRERQRNPYVRNPVPVVVPDLFDVPRQNIYGAPDFESPLTLERIPEGTEVLRITGRAGEDPNIATYPLPEEPSQRRTFLRELARTRRNIATSAPFTPDQIQRGPYRHRTAATSASATVSNKKKNRRRKTRKH